MRRYVAALETLFECAPDAYLVLAGEKIVEANRAACALFGDVIGSTASLVFADDCGALSAALAGAACALGEVGRNGRRYEFALTPNITEGHHAVIVRDVTEHRRLAELWERYQLLSESAHDIVLFIRRDGGILEANEAAAHAYGYDREKLRGLNIKDLRAPSTRDVVPHQMDKAFEGGLVFETLHLRRDGTTFPVEVSSRSAMIGAEPVLMSILRDLTERNAMQARLLHSDRMAAVGTLAAGVAHEINNPLAYAFTNLEVVARKLERISAALVDPPELLLSDLEVAKNALSIAREGADRVRAIVRDLKTFSRVDDVVRGPIDVRIVLDSCVNMAAAKLRHRARLLRDYSDVPLVEASESRIAQVFLNLLVNAAQAVDPSRASDNEIRLVVSTPSPAEVVIEVVDNGPGIPEELRARIFDPFVTTKPAGEGTGLGLFISREIVLALGGVIEAHSEVGRGTRMRVVLPAAPAQIASSNPPRASTANRAGGRMLVIDDEDSIGISLRRALEGEVSVVVTTGGLEALELLERDRAFDAILCDVVMPDVDGVAVHERIRVLYPELEQNFLFMTGGALSPETRAFLESMQGRLIEKPFSTDELRERLRRRSKAT